MTLKRIIISTPLFLLTGCGLSPDSVVMDDFSLEVTVEGLGSDVPADCASDDLGCFLPVLKITGHAGEKRTIPLSLRNSRRCEGRRRCEACSYHVDSFVDPENLGTTLSTEGVILEPTGCQTNARTVSINLPALAPGVYEDNVLFAPSVAPYQTIYLPIELVID